MANIKNLFKLALPHILVIIGFAVLSALYFYPELGGKQLRQSDMTNTRGVTNELVQWQKNHPDDEPMWTNSIFSGMPAYLIKMGKTYNIFRHIRNAITLGLPAGSMAILFMLLIGFYLLLQVIQLDRWLSIAGAIAFAFASYNIIIIAVGHITKAYAISFMPPLIAGIYHMYYNKKYLVGGLITLLSAGLLISSSHPQITYYALLTILLFFLIEFIYSIQNKTLKHYFVTGVIALVAAAIAVLPSITNLWTTAEYSKYSMRGPSEITKNKEEKKSTGLDRDYAFQWSYGQVETFSILVPNFVGAGVNGFKPDSKTAQQLKNVGINEEVAAQLPAYWGKLPFTVGPAYFGAIVCFLFVLGIFVVKGALKYWLLFAAILSILLSWGKNFSLLSDLFFYYFPGYNKFRTVDMILVIANFAFPLLGFLALKNIIENKIDKKEVLSALKKSLYIVGGLLIIFIFIPGWFFNFSSLSDNQLVEQLKNAKWPNDLIENLLAAMRDDRKSILQMDALRSLFYVIAAAALIWFYVKKSFKLIYLSVPLTLLILIDMWSVDRRYLNKDYFVPKSEPEFIKSHADEVILNDTDPHYRVLNLTRSVFNDGYTPYFHKSIGGYHGAKLRRYQDLIDGPLSADIMKIQQMLSSKTYPTETMLKGLPILNMLNCKYIIYHPDADPIINTARLGNAWFVKQINWVNSADEEYAEVSDPMFNPAATAIIDRRWEKALPNYENIMYDSTASITLLNYKPHELTYQSNTSSTQLVVFSEVFYEKGWNAYVDGKPVPHARANYILRTMIVPAGKHTIEFKFEPKTYETAKKISFIGSVIIVLLIIGTVIWEVWLKKQ